MSNARLLDLGGVRGLPALLFVLLLSVACGDSGGNGGTDPDPPRPTTLTISPASHVFEAIGASFQFSASVLDQSGQPMSSASVSWACSPGDVASVNQSGLVTANGVGTAALVATAGMARGEAALTVVVAPPEILTTLLPIGVLGSAYEATLSANGGTGSYTWLVTAGELPTGLALSADGVIAGQPTAVGEFTFTLQVSSGGKTASGEFNVSIQAPPVSITSDALANAVIGTAYTQTLTATGGDGTYAWFVNSGDFPDGLALAPVGTVSGTPTALGEFRFSLKATSAGQEATGYFIVTVVTGHLGLTLDGTQFELIPAGSFEMGSETGQPDESPVHSVTITQPFYMQKTEVTQAQWQKVMGENPSHFSSCGGMCPVDSVSWDDVQEFTSRVNQANEGMNYRLPTEAEWEYAARAGTTGDWGGTGNVDEMAWHLGNGRSRTHPVGLKEANAWGLHDMHGNVSEWVQDWYDWEYYKASPAIDPTGPATGTQRVLRGGDITSIAYQARSAWRGLLEPTARSYRAGFRLVRSQ